MSYTKRKCRFFLNIEYVTTLLINCTTDLFEHENLKITYLVTYKIN